MKALGTHLTTCLSCGSLSVTPVDPEYTLFPAFRAATQSSCFLHSVSPGKPWDPWTILLIVPGPRQARWGGCRPPPRCSWPVGQKTGAWGRRPWMAPTLSLFLNGPPPRSGDLLLLGSPGWLQQCSPYLTARGLQQGQMAAAL